MNDYDYIPRYTALTLLVLLCLTACSGRLEGEPNVDAAALPDHDNRMQGDAGPARDALSFADTGSTSADDTTVSTDRDLPVHPTSWWNRASTTVRHSAPILLLPTAVAPTHRRWRAIGSTALQTGVDNQRSNKWRSGSSALGSIANRRSTLTSTRRSQAKSAFTLQKTTVRQNRPMARKAQSRERAL